MALDAFFFVHCCGCSYNAGQVLGLFKPKDHGTQTMKHTLNVYKNKYGNSNCK